MSDFQLKDLEHNFNESWNRIVNILSEVFNTDVALINNVEGSILEVLKSNDSEENPFVENKLYDLASVYCDQVVKNEEMLEINNALKNGQWSDCESFKLGMLSYLGYPICNSKGKVVGTICVEDKNEKHFSETEKDMLLEFKGVIENQLKQLEYTERLQNNLEEGKKFHKLYLPRVLPDFHNYSFRAYYQSANMLGGDFYDVIEVEDKALFYVSDVSGHSLSGSMLNIFLKESILSYLFYHKNKEDYLAPSNIINNIIRRFKVKSFPADYFISLVLGIIDPVSSKIRLSNAGFQFPPLITSNEDGVSNLRCKGLPITILNEKIEYEEIEFTLEAGDTLHINTDGLFEQNNLNNKMYGEQRVIELLYKNSHLTPEKILKELYDDFHEFKGEIPLQDDLTSFLVQPS